MKQKSLNDKVQGARATLKTKPVGPTATERLVISVIDSNHTLAESFQKRDEATLEVLESLLKKDTTVTVDNSQVGELIAKAIEKIPAPVVNVPVREPVSYYAKIDRSTRTGEMIGALLSPVEKTQGVT